MTDADAVVLVVGSGTRPYREALLRSASGRHRIWLLDAEPSTWQAAYVTGTTVLDLHDRDAVLAAARRLAASRPVLGVFTWDEALIITTAYVADALGLPGAGVDGARGCRDKERMRALLTAAGLPQPSSVRVNSPDEAAAAAERAGYPVVVKPRGMGASMGVVRAGDPTQVRVAFEIAETASLKGALHYRGGALVEEFVTGDEISVDSAIVDGDCLPLFIARKRVGMAPFFEELGHLVDPADPLLGDQELRAVLARAHRVIGFGYGITHTEVKLSARGPVVIEINGRLGGDLISVLGTLATGVDVGAVAVQAALGLKPDVSARRLQTAGIRFGYPSQDCEVHEVTVPSPDPSAGLLLAGRLAEPGTRLRVPPGGYIQRHSFVICAAADPAACEERLDAAISRVRFQWRAHR